MVSNILNPKTGQVREERDLLLLDNFYKRLIEHNFCQKLDKTKSVTLGFLAFMSYSTEVIDAKLYAKKHAIELKFIAFDRWPQGFLQLIKVLRQDEAAEIEKTIFSVVDTRQMLQYKGKIEGPAGALDDPLIKRLLTAAINNYENYSGKLDYTKVMNIVSKAFAKNNIEELSKDFLSIDVLLHYKAEMKSSLLENHLALLNDYFSYYSKR